MSNKDIIIQDKNSEQGDEKPKSEDKQKIETESAVKQTPDKPEEKPRIMTGMIMNDGPKYKPVIFFSQSEKLMIGNPDLQKEEHFNSGQIAKEEAVIRFEGHFHLAKTQQEYDTIMKCYPPSKKDGRTVPNKNVMPVTRSFVAKYNKDEYDKRQGVRRIPIPQEVLNEPDRTPDINAEEAVSRFD